jgi:hypothetical protein
VITPRWLALMCAFKRHMPNLFRHLAQRRFRPYVSRSAPTAGGSKMTGTNGAD